MEVDDQNAGVPLQQNVTLEQAVVGLQLEVQQLQQRSNEDRRIINEYETRAIRRNPSKAQKPSKYYGERDDILIEAWLEDFEEYFQVENTRENEQTGLAGSYCMGTAKIWYALFRKKTKRNTPSMSFIPWRIFREAFTEQFCDPNGTLRYRTEWTHIRQGNDEMIKDFGQRIDMLAQYLEVPDEMAMDQFLLGIDYDLAVKIRLHKPEDLKAAIATGDGIEALDVNYNIKKKSKFKRNRYQSWMSSRTTSYSNATDDSRGTPMELDTMTRRKSVTSRPKTFMGKCYNCGKFGHKKDKCTRPKSIQSVSSKNSVSQ